MLAANARNLLVARLSREGKLVAKGLRRRVRRVRG